MNEIIYTIVTFIIIIASFHASLSRRRFSFSIGGSTYYYNNRMHFTYILILSSFFFGGNPLTFIRIFFFIILALVVIRDKKNIKLPSKRILYSFVLFYLWLVFTMSYSEGIYEGCMMLIKYSIPVIFFLLGYKSIDNRAEYIPWLKRVNLFIIIYILINGFAPTSFVTGLLGWNFFGGHSTYQMATFVAIPISLYYMTSQRKYLLQSLLYFLPSISFIRRAAFGAIFITSSIMMIWKNKIKAIVVIAISLSLIILAIFSYEPLKKRFFGGDKGSGRIESVTMETVQEEGLSENLNTSGREIMWNIVLERFYKQSPITGVGLGTMKSYITSSESEGGRAFLLLHNDYIHLLCETGIIGICLWFIFIISILYEIFDTLLNSKDRLLIFSALISLCALVAISFIMYFANILSTPMRFMQPFILFGFFLRLKHMEQKGKKNLIILHTNTHY